MYVLIQIEICIPLKGKCSDVQFTLAGLDVLISAVSWFSLVLRSMAGTSAKSLTNRPRTTAPTPSPRQYPFAVALKVLQRPSSLSILALLKPHPQVMQLLLLCLVRWSRQLQLLLLPSPLLALLLFADAVTIAVAATTAGVAAVLPATAIIVDIL
jgi:hypothetical protein